MKYISLVCMIALAGAVAIGCGTEEAGSPIIIGTGATGGNGNGTGGTGGAPEGACTTPENEAVYADLEYTNSDNITSMGTDSASAIAADCLRDIPKPLGCSNETAAVINELPVPTDPTILLLTDCVVNCTDVTVEELAGAPLTADCLACYGGSVACGAANCTAPCSADTNAPACVECRIANDCTPGFTRCSGIP